MENALSGGATIAMGELSTLKEPQLSEDGARDGNGVGVGVGANAHPGCLLIGGSLVTSVVAVDKR